MGFTSAWRGRDREPTADPDPGEPAEIELSEEWQRQLHSSYLSRFAADNQRIWFTASIFIPLSLAAFPALFSIKEPTLAHAIVLASVSTTLITFWLAVAERHRGFQDHYLRALMEIERRAVAGTGFEGLIERTHERPAAGNWPGVRRLRRGLTLTIVAGWVAVLAAFARHWLP